jgi:hypothetical protein
MCGLKPIHLSVEQERNCILKIREKISLSERQQKMHSLSFLVAGTSQLLGRKSAVIYQHICVLKN